MNIGDTIEWYQEGLIACGIIREINGDCLVVELTIDVGIFYRGCHLSVWARNVL